MEVRLHPLEFARRPLPFVCAVTGMPAAWYARVGVHRSMHPASLLLLFLGPIGWLILVFVALRSDGTYLEIPISETVYDQIQERRRRLRWLLVVVVGTLLVILAAGSQLVMPGAGLLIVLIAAVAVWAVSVRNPQVRIHLDGVNLVTISRCHPHFLTAVEQWRQLDSGAMSGH